MQILENLLKKKPCSKKWNFLISSSGGSKTHTYLYKKLILWKKNFKCVVSRKVEKPNRNLESSDKRHRNSVLSKGLYNTISRNSSILHVQTGFTECILFSSIKSWMWKIFVVSLVREALRVSLSLFWTRPSTKNFCKITQNSSFSVVSPEYTIIIYLGDMLLIGHTIEEMLIARSTVNFLLQQPGFALNLKKSVLTPTKDIEFLGVTLDSLMMNLSLLQKKLPKVQKQCQELLQKTQASILDLT